MLRLTEGVNRPEETLRNYVVTPQLVVCFDQALSLIKSAVEANSSKGVYLHGSFGAQLSVTESEQLVEHMLQQGYLFAIGIPVRGSGDAVNWACRGGEFREAKLHVIVLGV